LYFSLFYHVFHRITVIGWSVLAVVSRYCQILLLLLSILDVSRETGPAHASDTVYVVGRENISKH